jgi:OPA family glycerol-3-phosphate transporter-like MFS transporter
VSLGFLAHAVCKLLGGVLADFGGGRLNLLLGMGGSVAFTVLFSLGGLPIFTLAWIGNQAFQSLGWAGAVKASSRWFSPRNYGAAMGILSLSIIFGDAVSHRFLASLLEAGLGWRDVFFVTAGALAGVFTVSLFFLRESPAEAGEEEPSAGSSSLFGAAGEQPAPAGLRPLLAPLLHSRVFWLACLLSPGLTFLRESLNLWAANYVNQAARLDPAKATAASSLFPFLGGVSVVLFGFLSDALGRRNRAVLMALGLLLTGAGLLGLRGVDAAASRALALALTGFIGFSLMGPYSFLAGAIALDLGASRGAAR